MLQEKVKWRGWGLGKNTTFDLIIYTTLIPMTSECRFLLSTQITFNKIYVFSEKTKKHKKQGNNLSNVKLTKNHTK